MLYLVNLSSFAFFLQQHAFFLIGAHYCFALAKCLLAILQKSPANQKQAAEITFLTLYHYCFKNHKRILFVFMEPRRKKIFKSCKIQMEFCMVAS